MNIIENNIDLTKLNDGTIEDYPISIGYDKINFIIENNNNYTNSTIIPKNIHFIWIGNLICDKYVSTITNCSKINPEYNVYLWVDNTSINEDIKQYLLLNNINVKNIYCEIHNNLNNEIKNKILKYLFINDNYGFKADIIRLYVVYIYGGIYSDIDSVWIKPLDNNFNFEFVSYRMDNQCSNLTNSFFGFNQYSFILKNMIYNLNLSINCFLKENNQNVFKQFIPVISGPNFFTLIIKKINNFYLNYIHQGYCVIGGFHEDLYSFFSEENKSYCYQTFDKNWC